MSAPGLPSTLRPGQVLGRYEVLDALGKGGMGEVYRARDQRLGRVVALKLLPPRVVDDREQLLRFQNEARSLASLNHPGIVTLHSVEEEDGHHFLVMEYVEGESLRDAIPEDGMPLKAFFAVATALVDALAAAHERGIVHRDLKPENVMFTRGGRLKVLDFGLARFDAHPGGPSLGEDSPTAPLTQEGLIVGTLPYLSPEQVLGRPADHRSDLFTLGILLFEMLTGTRPFQGESPVSLMSAILRDAPPGLGDLRDGLPQRLEAILLRCLEKAPEDRYPSAQALLADLQGLRDDLEAARVISAPDAASGGPLPSAAARPRRTGSLAPLHGLLAAVMAVNVVETSAETWLREAYGLGVDLGDRLAEAAHGLESGLSFEAHDLTNPLAVRGYALAYFVLFPLMALGTAWSLARRKDGAYRELVCAVVLVYAISLPFFLFFPVPERWYYPESGAILLSDLWSSRFIEAFRPISGIDNCFPSFHTSLMTILALAAYRHRLKHRHALACLSLLVVASTFALGIHWLPDIAAGIAAGILASALAVRVSAKWDLARAAAATTAKEELPPTEATARTSTRPGGSRG